MRRAKNGASVGAGGETHFTAASSSLIPVGSLAVLDIQVEKIEDQKLYMSCIAQSRDKQTVYAKSSGKDICSLSLGLPAVTQPTTKGREEEGLIFSSNPKLESSAFRSRDVCLLETGVKRKRTKLKCFPR